MLCAGVDDHAVCRSILTFILTHSSPGVAREPEKIGAPRVEENEPGVKQSLDIRYYPGKDRQTLDVIAPPPSTA